MVGMSERVGNFEDIKHVNSKGDHMVRPFDDYRLTRYACCRGVD